MFHVEPDLNTGQPQKIRTARSADDGDFSAQPVHSTAFARAVEGTAAAVEEAGPNPARSLSHAVSGEFPALPSWTAVAGWHRRSCFAADHAPHRRRPLLAMVWALVAADPDWGGSHIGAGIAGGFRLIPRPTWRRRGVAGNFAGFSRYCRVLQSGQLVFRGPTIRSGKRRQSVAD